MIPLRATITVTALLLGGVTARSQDDLSIYRMLFCTPDYNRDRFTIAMNCYRDLADKGDAESQWHIGLMFYRGQGVIQDFDEAFNWFRLAAEQGNFTGQAYLGKLYERGEGVSQDYLRAHMWYNIAASNGAPSSNRDRVAANISSSSISRAQTMAQTCTNSEYKDCGWGWSWW